MSKSANPRQPYYRQKKTEHPATAKPPNKKKGKNKKSYTYTQRAPVKYAICEIIE